LASEGGVERRDVARPKPLQRPIAHVPACVIQGVCIPLTRLAAKMEGGPVGIEPGEERRHGDLGGLDRRAVLRLGDQLGKPDLSLPLCSTEADPLALALALWTARVDDERKMTERTFADMSLHLFLFCSRRSKSRRIFHSSCSHSRYGKFFNSCGPRASR